MFDFCIDKRKYVRYNTNRTDVCEQTFRVLQKAWRWLLEIFQHCLREEYYEKHKEGIRYDRSGAESI